MSTTLLTKFVDQKDEVDDICNIITNGASGLDVSVDETEQTELEQAEKRKEPERQPLDIPSEHKDAEHGADADVVAYAGDSKKLRAEAVAPAELAV